MKKLKLFLKMTILYDVADLGWYKMLSFLYKLSKIKTDGETEARSSCVESKFTQKNCRATAMDIAKMNIFFTLISTLPFRPSRSHVLENYFTVQLKIDQPKRFLIPPFFPFFFFKLKKL